MAASRRQGLASNRKQIKCIAYLHAINCHLHCVADPEPVDGMRHAIQTTRPQTYAQSTNVYPSVCLHVWLSVCLTLTSYSSVCLTICICVRKCVCVCVWHAKPSFCMHQRPPPTRGTAISQRRCMFYHNLPAVAVAVAVGAN